MEIAAQIVGFIGIITGAIIYQQKTRKGLMIMKLISDVIWALHYILLGAYSGMAICVLAVFRELIFMNRGKYKWASLIIWPIIFASAALGTAALTWNGPISILPAVASATSVIAFWIGKPRLSRTLAFPIASEMVIYDIFNGSYAGIINEAIGITSAIIGIIRLDIKRKNKNGGDIMKKLLVVVDMQNDFIDGALGTPEAQMIVPNVSALIEKFDGDIVFTRDTHKKNYLETEEGKNLPVLHCIKGTHGWEFTPLIDMRSKKIFDKNGFGSPKLGAFVRRGGYDEVEVCGLCTDICVIVTAMMIKAYAPNTKITVDADCSAGVTPAQHEIALDALAPCQINVTGRGSEPWKR